MKKLRIGKILLVATVVVLSSIVLMGVYFAYQLINPPISRERMMRIFSSDLRLLNEAVANIRDIGYSNIYISRGMERGEMSVRGQRVEINDFSTALIINLLMMRGYRVIVKNENEIRFQRWSNLDNGRGFVYSFDGSVPIAREGGLMFLTHIEPMSVPHWFYFEEDFNLWRVQRRADD